MLKGFYLLMILWSQGAQSKQGLQERPSHDMKSANERLKPSMNAPTVSKALKKTSSPKEAGEQQVFTTRDLKRNTIGKDLKERVRKDFIKSSIKKPSFEGCRRGSLEGDLKSFHLNKKGIELLKGLQNKTPLERSLIKGAESVSTLHKDKKKIYIFISFSLSKNTLRGLFREAKRSGATLLLRGLKDNSWRETFRVLKPLLKEGADIQIDPKKFKEFEVKVVPTFAFATFVVPTIVVPRDGKSSSMEGSNKDSYHKVSGSISLKRALEIMGEKS